MAARTPGQFQPGQSGNPKGRPKGAGAAHKLRVAMGKDLEKVIEKLTAQALAGDVQAAKLLLDRTVAPLRPMEAPASLSLPDGSSADQSAAVIRAIAAGEIAPSQGAALLQAITNLARVIELTELEARLRALEERREG